MNRIEFYQMIGTRIRNRQKEKRKREIEVYGSKNE